MQKKYSISQNNPLKTRADLMYAVKQLCDPLKPHYSEKGAFLDVGNTSSRTSEKVAQFEAFARPLWGLAPLLSGGEYWDYWEVYLKGIRSGTDPSSSEHWGDIHDCDQRMVELAAIALTLILTPDQSWAKLIQKEKENLANWMGQTNERITVDTNWRFFRVLVNVAFLKLGVTHNQKMMDEDLNRLDEFYLSNGWYKDGDTNQMDYYVPFAFHFYSLIYSKVMEKKDPKRSQLFKERAVLFAKDFIYWFGEDGAALAFGRSLTYRFAQSCFWSALAFADVEAFSWGVIKGVLLRNLRWWFAQPIFATDGILTIGYAYPNLIMAESYNAPGSPYWAMKSFLPLALSEDHPFWKAEELPMPALETMSIQKEARMILCREDSHKNIVAFTSGQHAGFEPAHTAAKYAKFAYSNVYAFSVPKGNFGLEQGAFDNDLALAEKDNLYRTRRKCEVYKIENNVIYSLWKPWSDVSVESWIIPGIPWHVRVHRIQTNRELDIAEGGFSIPKELNKVSHKDSEIITDSSSTFALFSWGAAGIKSLLGDMEGQMIHPEPNTNLIHSKTVLPTLTKELEKGIHWIASAVFVHSDGVRAKETYKSEPWLEIVNSTIIIKDKKQGTKLFEITM